MRVCSPTIDSSRRETEQICGGVETYNERSLRLKYRSQGVQTLFYESTPSMPNPLGDQIPPGARINSRHAGTNHPHASEERNNNGASELPRILPNPSQQQKVPQVRLREQGVPVSGATLWSEHSPSDFYAIGAHGDRLSSPSGDLGDTISR